MSISEYHVELKAASEHWDFAAALARIARVRDVITLTGDMGSGKTFFARAFISTLARVSPLEKAEPVVSPSYLHLHVYPRLPAEVWHYDWSRVHNGAQLQALGLDEALDEGITIIEWPQRYMEIIPTRQRLDIAIASDSDHDADKEARHLHMRADRSWAARLATDCMAADFLRCGYKGVAR